MFTNGNISRGVKAQKKMNTEERVYLYCRGRKNIGLTGGWETDSYSNEINARILKSPSERDVTNSQADVTRWFIFPSPSASEQTSNCFAVGTRMQIDTGLRRYLVIEGKAGANSSVDFAVMLSRTKDLDDDGLYYLEFETEYRKRYIDLREDGNISGTRYIVLLAGINGWNNPTEYDIKRVYLTDEKESDIEILYNRGDNSNTAMWEVDMSPLQSQAPVFQTDYIEMYPDAGKTCNIITGRNIKNVNENHYLGILYEGVEVQQEESGIYFTLTTSNGQYITSGGWKPAAGINRVFFRMENYNGPLIQPGEYKIRVSVGLSHKIKILAIWMQM